MNKNSKYKLIRDRIKVLSEKQKILKPQRKTIYFHGNRTMESYQANSLVISNKYELMHLYLAYAKIKDIDIPMPTKKEYSNSIIESFVQKYSVFQE